MIVAIDGTAASGKGSLARKLSKKLNLNHLDSGILYRIIADKAINLKIESINDKKIIDLAESLTVDEFIEINNSKSINLKSSKISKKASEIALNFGVRKVLVNLLRQYVNIDNFDYNGFVLDGRDIGTIVFPDANFKFYLDANVKIRAERRTQELIHLNYKVIYHDVLKDLINRDERDKNRTVGPLKKAKDAFFIDTGNKSEEIILEEVLKLIKIN